MRLSSNRHVLSVLRRVLGGMRQVDLANFLGCSVETIRKIEKGCMKLSPKLAGSIAIRTGVSEQWLLANDMSAPPVSPHTSNYGVTFFEGWSSGSNLPLSFDLLTHAALYSMTRYLRLRAVAAAAALRGEFYFERVMAEVSVTLEKLAGEFGAVEAFGSSGHANSGLSGEGLLLIERDALAARLVLEENAPTPLPPRPAPEDISAHRAWQQEHELSPFAPRDCLSTPGNRTRDRLIYEEEKRQADREEKAGRAATMAAVSSGENDVKTTS